MQERLWLKSHLVTVSLQHTCTFSADQSECYVCTQPANILVICEGMTKTTKVSVVVQVLLVTVKCPEYLF